MKAAMITQLKAEIELIENTETGRKVVLFGDRCFNREIKRVTWLKQAMTALANLERMDDNTLIGNGTRRAFESGSSLWDLDMLR